MKKKLFLELFLFLGIICITGCGKGNESTLDNGTKLASKGKCVATECIKQIKIENTVEEINDIIGFDGEVTDEKYNKYYWELSEDTGIEVTYYSDNKGTIEVDIDMDLLANKNVSFSRYNELQPKIKEGITYDEFKTYVGNVDGTLIEKGSISNKYVWVAKDGSYLNAAFSNSSGKCTFASGMVK